MRKVPLLHRSMMNTYTARVLQDGDRLDYLTFKEDEGEVVIDDNSGHNIPLSKLIYASPDGNSSVQAVRKSKLSKKMCIILGETENFYIIKEVK